MIADADPRHGADRGYMAGCRRACCRAGHALAARRYRNDPDPRPRRLPLGPSRRRLDALACLGWSRQALSHRLGMSRNYLRHVVNDNQVLTRTTADKIAALYDELRDLECPSDYASRTRREAAALRLVPPDGWADIEAGVLLADAIPEKACGCHPRMPNVRTPIGFACLGCGWGAVREDLIA